MSETIAVDEAVAKAISAKLSTGAFETASDVVAEGLRLMAERDAALVRLRDAIDQGDREGGFEAIDFDAFLRSKRAAAG
jgi:antitoxin ParD1/3/4